MAIVITYKRTRGLSMRIVKSGDVHVSAPLGMRRSDVEAFISAHSEWVEKAGRRLAENMASADAFYGQLPLETRAQKAQAAEKLASLVSGMLDRYCPQIGVSPESVRYRPMKSRWGVCNVRERRICFSTYLLLLPQWCVEHVVVHELCHLIEPSHNARFYALMDRYFPSWREARTTTRRHVYGFHPCKN